MKISKREILIEGRVEDLKLRYVNNPELEPIKRLRPSEFNKLVAGDPSGNQKYLEWMIKVMISGFTLGIDSGYIMKLVTEFHNKQHSLPKKDLYQYKGWNELEKAIGNLQPSKSEIKRIEKSGAERLYEDENYLLVSPKTKEASCHYGQGTKWCTSAKINNAFDEYQVEGVLFYIINKSMEKSDRLHGRFSKVAMYVNFEPLMFNKDITQLDEWDYDLYDALDDPMDGLWEDFVRTPLQKTFNDKIMGYYRKEYETRGDKIVEGNKGLENLIYIKKMLKEINQESDFGWAEEISSEGNLTYLSLNVGEPDWEYDDDGELIYEDPDWKYWELFMYVPNHVFSEITGVVGDSGWDEFTIDGEEGSKLLNLFYVDGFAGKQKSGSSTDIREGEQDGSFMPIDKETFCNKVGEFHPNMCR